MSTSLLLGIVGVLTTIVFGGLSIYIVLRARYPGRISFFEEESIGLFDSIVRNLPNLAVLYKGTPVGQTLVLLKGSFLNTGTKDITEPMVEEPLTINLPNGYRWLEAKVVSPRANEKMDAQIRGELSLVFPLGLFKREEYLRFEALAEVPTDEGDPALRLKRGLEFTHRIADTQSVEQRMLPRQAASAFNWSIIPLACIFGAFWGLVGYAVLQPSQEIVYQPHWLLTTDSNKTIEVTWEPQTDYKVNVQGVNEPYSESIPASDLFSNGRLRLAPLSDSRKPRSKGSVLIAAGFALAMAILLLAVLYVRHKQARKVRLLLGLELR